MKQSYYQLWALIRLGKVPVRTLIFATILVMLTVLASLGFPILTQQLIDRLGTDQPVALLAGSLVLVLFLAALCNVAARILIAKLGHGVSTTLRLTLIDKLLTLPVSFFDTRDTGDQVSRILNDCESISDLATEHISNLINGILLLLGSVIILLWLDVQLTLTLLATLIIAFVIAAPAVMKMESIATDYQQQTANLSGILTQIFSEIKMVKIFTAEKAERKRCRTVVQTLREQALKLDKLRIIFEEIIDIAISIAFLTILIYGGYRVAIGDLSIGVLTAFILYIFNVAAPMAQISGFFSELQTAKGASAYISTILKEVEEQQATEHAVAALPEQVAGLECRNLSFAYPEQPRRVLEHFNLTIAPGETLALVGKSGSGKSTLLALIERFYQPSAGGIYYNAIPIQHYPLEAWRKSIAYVSQNSPVMPGTIRDNLHYGLEHGITDAQLTQALRNANALDFVERLPMGLETILSEQGGNLSGGERQRIAIARMFLRNPAILLLDEATSSLDSHTEQQVNIALDNLILGRTCIVIAHRFSTILRADKIAVLEEGNIIDCGSHETLLARCAAYEALLRAQFSEQILAKL
ncbi:ABC transporter ATP-binding protein [Alishewanella sp. d11]|uniref:ABC transporter ATP-binding protein n=1 Tax=Alishewanella sp. d11 TaxID=3414030 RepID=UPI003BF80280